MLGNPVFLFSFLSRTEADMAGALEPEQPHQAAKTPKRGLTLKSPCKSLQVPLEKPGPAPTEPGDAWEPEATPTHSLPLRPHLGFAMLSGPVPIALLVFSWWQVGERTT